MVKKTASLRSIGPSPPDPESDSEESISSNDTSSSNSTPAAHKYNLRCKNRSESQTKIKAPKPAPKPAPKVEETKKRKRRPTTASASKKRDGNKAKLAKRSLSPAASDNDGDDENEDFDLSSSDSDDDLDYQPDSGRSRDNPASYNLRDRKKLIAARRGLRIDLSSLARATSSSISLDGRNYLPEEREPQTTFDGLKGMDEIIRDLRRDVVCPFAYPRNATHLKLDVPRGVLLLGKPGTGKTSIADAIVAEIRSKGRRVRYRLIKGDSSYLINV